MRQACGDAGALRRKRDEGEHGDHREQESCDQDLVVPLKFHMCFSFPFICLESALLCLARRDEAILAYVCVDEALELIVWAIGGPVAGRDLKRDALGWIHKR